jgi:hypothetical protein
MNGKITMAQLSYFFYGSGQQFIGKNYTVLNETAPLPDRTSKQSFCYNSVRTSKPI